MFLPLYRKDLNHRKGVVPRRFLRVFVHRNVKRNLRMWGSICIVLLAGQLTCQNLWAGVWRVDYDASSVGFIATYDEIPFEGRFEEFESVVHFDPSALDQASFKVNIVVASVNTDSPDRDEGMLEQEFFDAPQYPNATFTSTAFTKSTDKDGYEVIGDLIIKGISKPVSLGFTWEESDNAVRLQGQGVVRRTDFEIGTGDWEEDDTIGFNVRIVFDLSLRE